MALKDVKWTTVLVHLLCLCTLSIGQPLYDLVGKYPEFFFVRDIQPWQLAIFIAFVSLAVPLLLVSAWSLLRLLNRTAASIFFVLCILLTTTALSLQVVKAVLYADQEVKILVVLLSGLILTVLYLKFLQAQKALWFLAGVNALAPLFFLYNYVSSANTDNVQESFGWKPEHQVPVVLILFDELPLSGLLDSTLAIDKKRFPNFYALSRESTWYRNASTVGDLTSVAVPALLSGVFPVLNEQQRPLKAIYREHPRNLFTLLGDSHTIFAREWLTRLCPPSICDLTKLPNRNSWQSTLSLLDDTVVLYLHMLVPNEYRKYLPSIEGNWGGFGLDLLGVDSTLHDPALGLQTAQRLTTMKDDELHYAHLYFPHRPYRYYPSGKTYTINKVDDLLDFTGKTPGQDRQRKHAVLKAAMSMWGDDTAAQKIAYQRYLMQLAYTDVLLGKLIGAIKSSGRFDNAFVIVTADHGSNFSPSSRFRLATPDNFKNIMSVPLFIKYPQQKSPEVDDSNVQLTDILPTIDDVLQVNSGWNYSGRSLLSPAGSPVKRIISTSNGPILTIPEAEARRIFAADERNSTLVDSLGEKYLFDMSSDRTWLDRKVADLAVIESAEKANIPLGDMLGNVDTAGDSLPGLVRFEVGQHLFAASTEFAAALNGVIFATHRLSPAGAGKFDLIVPEQLFRQGKNDLALYIINKKTEPVVFQHLELTYDK